MIPGVEQVAPGVAQVARGLAQLAPGASRVATGLAQFAPGVVGITYANFYRNLLSYYQSHYANRNQQFGYPLMHNQNVGKGALRARQRVANLHNVHYNKFQKKKVDYKYQPTKHSNKYPDGYYKDKYPSNYPEGTYKELDKYPTDDKYSQDTIYQPGYYHDKHPKDYHHDPPHNKYPTEYSGDINAGQKYKETYSNGYLRDKFPKDYKGDKHPTDLYSNDNYPNGKYIGINAHPLHDERPHDYQTEDKYYDGKYKETYPKEHLNDKYPNRKQGEYYPNAKYPNENFYMSIHGNPNIDKYPIDKYPDGHYKASQSDYPRDKYNKKQIRPNFRRNRRGDTDSQFEFGVPVSDVTGKNRPMDHAGDFDDVVSHPRYRLLTGGLFSGSISDHSAGIGWGLLDVGPLSPRGRHNHIHPTYTGKGIPEKYPGVQHKKHKFDTYHNKGYKDSISHKYDTYQDYKDNKYRTGEKYDYHTYPYKDYKYTTDQKYGTYQNAYKYNTEQKYDTYPKKDSKYTMTHIGSVYPDHDTRQYPTGHLDSYKGLYGNMTQKKDYKLKGNTHKKRY